MENLENIPQMEPLFGDEEAEAVYEYMKDGAWLTEFRKTREFEQSIADYTGAKHVVAVNNGTVALSVALIAAGIGPGDEVIVPNYTMIATPNSVQLLGAKPIFADVCPRTLCLTTDKIQEKISVKTKAVILVYANGRNPVESACAIERLCKENALNLIEDSAQSLGSFTSDGIHQGLIGDIGTLSFSAPKIISTGQGGALMTNSDEFAAKIRKIKDFGRSGGGSDIHDTLGYNFKFTDMQACVGIEQMKKLKMRVSRKKQICQRYQENLRDLPEVRFFDQDLEMTTPWFIDGLFKDRDLLSSRLKDRGIGTRVMYPPINRQKAYSELESYFEVSELVGVEGLWLPSSIQLTDAAIDRVCDEIKRFYRSRGES